MKYTAKACLSSSGQKKGVVIGIAPWSVVNNKQVCFGWEEGIITLSTFFCAIKIYFAL